MKAWYHNSGFLATSCTLKRTVTPNIRGLGTYSLHVPENFKGKVFELISKRRCITFQQGLQHELIDRSNGTRCKVFPPKSGQLLGHLHARRTNSDIVTTGG